MSRIARIVFILGTALFITNISSLSYAELFASIKEGIPAIEYEKTIHDELYSKYFRIWMNVFKQTQNIDDETFNKHIYITWMYHNYEHENSDYLVIHLTVKKDWFVSNTKLGSITIRVKSQDKYYYDKYFDDKLGKYLTEEEALHKLQAGRDELGLGNWINKPLHYKNVAEVITKFKAELGVEKIEGHWLQPQIVMGNPIIDVRVDVNRKENACKQGRMNLTTGVVEVWNVSCVKY